MIRPTPAKKSKLTHIYAIITIVLWSLGYVMTRIAIQHFTPEAISFLRYFVAALALFIYALIKKPRLPKLNDIPMFFVGGAIGFAIYVYFINVGSKTLTASAVSFIISASPVITAILARIILGEKIGLIGWLSIFCAFAGVGVITFYNGGFTLNSGVIWICAAAVLISCYNIFQRKLMTRYSPLEITTYCIMAGAILLSVFAPQSFPQMKTASITQIITVLILGIFSGGVAYTCWAYALNKAKQTSEVTNYMFTTPVITTFLGFVLIGETPHASVYIGGILVLLGVFFINKRNWGINKNR